MAKTNPIGVRFDEDMLVVLQKDHGIDSPQKALNFLYNYWRMNKHKIDPMTGVLREPAKEESQKEEVNQYEMYKDGLHPAVRQIKDFIESGGLEENPSTALSTEERNRLTALITSLELEQPPSTMKSEPGRAYWKMKQKQKVDDIKKLLS